MEKEELNECLAVFYAAGRREDGTQLCKFMQIWRHRAWRSLSF